MANAVASLCEVRVLAEIDLFVLERLHEALRLGVVIGIPPTAHADGDSGFSKQIGVLDRCILDAAVGVVDQAWLHVAVPKRHPERSQCQLRVYSSGEFPTDHPA